MGPHRPQFLLFILFASLWEVRARKGLIVPAAGGGGGNRATNNTKITNIYKKKNFKSKSKTLE